MHAPFYNINSTQLLAICANCDTRYGVAWWSSDGQSLSHCVLYHLYVTLYLVPCLWELCPVSLVIVCHRILYHLYVALCHIVSLVTGTGKCNCAPFNSTALPIRMNRTCRSSLCHAAAVTMSQCDIQYQPFCIAAPWDEVLHWWTALKS